ncbi:PREDICTED: fasciclin-1-like [Priapulus caudatus]|uniref:Fasciclin-1-like n=1 Tax=Priapulus caudatus TaxID=37621 RepID=A0ABM1FA48_PRICU|nr:PREDICTED: fasciclin-1-like [Priapulus caudatus]
MRGSSLAVFILLFAFVRSQTLMDVIQGDYELKKFLGFAQKYLKNALSETGYTYTVFAPTDEAIERYLKENNNDGRGLDSLRTWNYHLLNDRYTHVGFMQNRERNFSLATLAPKSAPVWMTVVDPPFIPGQQFTQFGGQTASQIVHVNQARVLLPEISSLNGVLHKIDRVLSPPGVGETIWGLVRDPRNLYTEYQLTQLRSMPQSMQVLLDQSVSGKSSIGLYGNAGRGFQPGGVQAGGVQQGNPQQGRPQQGLLPGGIQPGGFDPNPSQGGFQPGGQTGRRPPQQQQGVFQPGIQPNQQPPRDFQPAFQPSFGPQGAAEKYTMFLPNDQAFNQIPSEQRNLLVQDSRLFERILQAHMIRGYVVFSNNFEKSQTYDGYSTSDRVKLHFDTRGNITENIPVEFYVATSLASSTAGMMEGDVYARVVVPNIAVDNGVVHIVDNVLGYIYRNTEETIQTHRNMTKLWTEILVKNYMKEFRDQLRTQDMTMFVPSNAAFEKIPVQKLTDLLRDEQRVADLVRLHMAFGRVYLRNQDNSTTLDTTLPVGGGPRIQQTSYASDYDPNYDQDRDNQGRDQNDQNRDRPQQQRPQQQQIGGQGGNYKQIRFMIMQNGTAKTWYVNGNGVWAEVLQQNLGTSNGVIHLVDSILGFPYQTIWQKIEEDPMLSDLERYIDKTGYDLRNMLSAEYERFTMFAMSNDAWQDIYSRNYNDFSIITTSNLVLGHVIKNHLVRGQVLSLDDLYNNVHLGTVNGKTITLRQDGYNRNMWSVRLGEIEATITLQGMAMTNGYIYIIDRVLYENWDLNYNGAMGMAATLSTTLLLALVAKFVA